MSNENNDSKNGSGIEIGNRLLKFSDIILFVEGVFVCGVWFAFILMVMGFFGVIGTPYREHIPILDALYLITGFIILSTIIIVLQFSRLNNTLKEVKKAIEEKQPVIIQKKVTAPEQEKKQNGNTI